MAWKCIYLTEERQEYLKDFVKNGVHNSHEITRARVLLLLDRTGKVDHVRCNRISEYTNISVQAVYNMRDEYIATQDIESYLRRKKRETPPTPPKLYGEQEARLLRCRAANRLKATADGLSAYLGIRLLSLELSTPFQQQLFITFKKNEI